MTCSASASNPEPELDEESDEEHDEVATSATIARQRIVPTEFSDLARRLWSS
jgi:hypothetical protein